MKKKIPILLSGQGTLQDRLYHSIRSSILQGVLKPGAQLPSSRELSQEISVSRNTVQAVFDQLSTEGYTTGRIGSGTYVSTTLPDNLMAISGSKISKNSGESMPLPLGKRSEILNSFWSSSQPRDSAPQPFSVGMSAVDHFPAAVWGRLLGRCWRESQDEIVNHVWPSGHPRLRRIIADYARSSRGLQCTDDQIVIVNGTQQAISLAAQVVLNDGDAIWMEDPGYDCARAIFAAAGAQIHPVEVDTEGLTIEAGKVASADARLAFVTPSRQFPLGITMSLRRRLALLEWAHRQQCWVFEDDYDHEFRYSGRPIQALQGLDTHGRVIYSGTFSKMMFPGLRLGFLVLPPPLVEAFSSAKYFADGQTSMLEQLTMAAFIEEGHYSSHVRRTRRLCAERQSVLIREVNRQLPGKLEVHPSEAGLHLIGWLPEGSDAASIAELCQQKGVDVHPLSRYTIRNRQREGLVMGYAAYSPARIRAGVRRLASVLEKLF